MRIASVHHTLPSQRIANESVLQKIHDSAAHLSSRERATVTKAAATFLDAAGTETRYQLGQGEKAIDLVLQAGRDSLISAGKAPDEVDLVIYTGVGRGWIEPAMANAVQSGLGLVNATCFDILDACASWLRALHVTYNYLCSGTYRCAMIVNCECGLYRRYGDWAIDSVDTVSYRLAGATIGEVATATILTADDTESEWYFAFKTFGEHFKLCMLPLAGLEDFWAGPVDERFAPGRFTTFSRELLSIAARKAVEVFRNDPRLRNGRYDVCFAHNASEKVCEFVTDQLGVRDIFFPTHRRYGNNVSAAIPLGMSLALQEGRLRRGDKVLIIVGSAGITVGFATFTF